MTLLERAIAVAVIAALVAYVAIALKNSSDDDQDGGQGW